MYVGVATCYAWSTYMYVSCTTTYMYYLSQHLYLHYYYYLTRMHNIGFTPRPTLRGRASLYDLIKTTTSTRTHTTDTDPLSATAAATATPTATAKLVEAQPDLIASTVPLPSSPQQQHHHRRLSLPPATSPVPERPPQSIQQLHINVRMVPVSFHLRKTRSYCVGRC
jgi:hypothetical protein